MMPPQFGFTVSEAMMGTGTSDRPDLADDDNHEVINTVQIKDPGMNAEVLNIIPHVSDDHLLQTTTQTFVHKEKLSSPFLVTSTEKLQKKLLHDDSLLESPFLVKNDSDSEFNDLPIKHTMFNLEDIFMESNLYPSGKPYEEFHNKYLLN